MSSLPFELALGAEVLKSTFVLNRCQRSGLLHLPVHCSISLGDIAQKNRISFPGVRHDLREEVYLHTAHYTIRLLSFLQARYLYRL